MELTWDQMEAPALPQGDPATEGTDDFRPPEGDDRSFDFASEAGRSNPIDAYVNLWTTDSWTCSAAPLTTGVAVASLSAQAQIIQVIIRDDTGAQLGTPTISLSALGHTSFMLSPPPPGFPVTNGMRGTVEFDTPPGGQISVLGLRANGPALTTLPVLANVGTSGGSITHVAFNGGWTSVFYLVNTGNASAQFTLSFFDESGNPLSVPLLLPQTGTTVTTQLTQTLAVGAMLVVNTQAEDAPMA